ncbi:RND transporter, partial [Methylobacterium sp. WL116]
MLTSTTRRKRAATILALAAALTVAAPAVEAPRGASSTDALELVAVARDGRLTLFLDRADTNEPVADATIEAKTPAGKAAAVAGPDGSYRLDAPWSAVPGDYDVLFTVTVGGKTDLFPVDLDVPVPPAPTPEPAPWHAGLAVAHDFGAHLRSADPMPFLVGGAGFVLGILATVLMRGRRSGAALALVVRAAG